MANPTFFDDTKRETVETSAGICEMPILYRDASLFTFGTRVDGALAASCIPAAQQKIFEPWLIFGKAIALFCAFEYRETTIGPYGEVGVGILVKRTGTSPSKFRAVRDLRKEEDAGLFVVNLPVTTQSAFAAGTELWGYPKYVTPISTHFRKDSIKITVGDELEVTAGKSGRLTTQGIPLVLYSTNNGRILRTIVDTDFTAAWGGSSNITVKIKNDGPTAKTMRHLGMDRATPAFAFRTYALRSMLPLGRDMGGCDEAKSSEKQADSREAAE